MTDANIRAANLRSGDVQVIDTVSAAGRRLAARGSRASACCRSGRSATRASPSTSATPTASASRPGTIDTPLAEDRPGARRPSSSRSTARRWCNSVFNNWSEPACSPISPDTDVRHRRRATRCPPYDPAPLAAAAERGRRRRRRCKLTDDGVQHPRHAAARPGDPGQRRQGRLRPRDRSRWSTPPCSTPRPAATSSCCSSAGPGRIDPHGNMFAFLATGQANNYSGYSDPEVDKLLDKAARQVDTDERGRDLRRGGRARAARRPDRLPLPAAQPDRLLRGRRRRLDVRRRGGPARPGRRSWKASDVMAPLPAQPPRGSPLVTLFLASLVVFCGVRALPGDPALALAGEEADPATLKAVRADLGLDQPVFVQYLAFVGEPRCTATSAPPSRTGTPVADLITATLPVTLWLSLYARAVRGRRRGRRRRRRRGLPRPLARVGGQRRSPSSACRCRASGSASSRSSTSRSGCGWFPASGYVPVVRGAAARRSTT